MSAIVRERTASTAQEHAKFVTHSLIQPALSQIELDGPLRPDDPRYEALRALVVADVLGVQFPVVRVNVWGSDGTVLFSDEPRLSHPRRGVTAAPGSACIWSRSWLRRRAEPST